MVRLELRSAVDEYGRPHVMSALGQYLRLILSHCHKALNASDGHCKM